MIKIDLHDYYPHEPKGSFVEVSDEIAETLMDFERQEIARQVKEYRYQAYYSLDALDGIENETLAKVESPYDILERQFVEALLYDAITKLPEKQARRIFAHYILEKSLTNIARLEGVKHTSVLESIKRALAALKMNLKDL